MFRSSLNHALKKAINTVAGSNEAQLAAARTPCSPITATRHLSSLPGQEDAGKQFLEQVEAFYDKAASLLESSLVERLPARMSQEDKIKKVRGILSIIKPANNVLEISFPIKKDNGQYEIISAWRAQHSHHRTPCKGGIAWGCDCCNSSYRNSTFIMIIEGRICFVCKA